MYICKYTYIYTHILYIYTHSDSSLPPQVRPAPDIGARGWVVHGAVDEAQPALQPQPLAGRRDQLCRELHQEDGGRAHVPRQIGEVPPVLEAGKSLHGYFSVALLHGRRGIRVHVAYSELVCVQ